MILTSILILKGDYEYERHNEESASAGTITDIKSSKYYRNIGDLWTRRWKIMFIKYSNFGRLELLILVLYAMNFESRNVKRFSQSHTATELQRLLITSPIQLRAFL